MSAEPDSPWQRRDDETTKAFKAFQFYMNLEANERSALRAWYEYAEWNWDKTRAEQERTNGKPRAPGFFRAWSSDYDWVERAEAWDNHLATIEQRKREQEHRQKLEEHRQQQEKFARVMRTQSVALLEKLNKRIAKLKPEDLGNPQDISRLIRANVEAFRAATEAESRALAVEELVTLLLEQE